MYILIKWTVGKIYSSCSTYTNKFQPIDKKDVLFRSQLLPPNSDKHQKTLFFSTIKLVAQILPIYFIRIGNFIYLKFFIQLNDMSENLLRIEASIIIF